jgi:hypothetical protein
MMMGTRNPKKFELIANNKVSNSFVFINEANGGPITNQLMKPIKVSAIA